MKLSELVEGSNGKEKDRAVVAQGDAVDLRPVGQQQRGLGPGALVFVDQGAQVGVAQEDASAATGREPRLNGGALAAVDRVLDDPDARIVDPTEDLERGVGRGVVDRDQLAHPR